MTKASPKSAAGGLDWGGSHPGGGLEHTLTSLLKNPLPRVKTRTLVLAQVSLTALFIVLLAAASAFDAYQMSRSEDAEYTLGRKAIQVSHDLRKALQHELGAAAVHVRAPDASSRRELANSGAEYLRAYRAAAEAGIPGQEAALRQLAAAHDRHFPEILAAPPDRVHVSMIAARRALDEPLNALTRSTLVHIDSLHASVNRQEREILIRLGVLVSLAVLMVAGLAIILVTRVTAPLGRLEACAEALAQGDLSVRVPVPQDDEFGRVATSFNRMAEDIEQTVTRLRESNEALQRANEVKGQFLSMVSHELRTPLATIVGYAEFLEDGLAGHLTAPQAEFLAEIQSGSQRLALLVDDLLDVARIEAGNFRMEIRAADLVERISDALRSVLPQAQAKRVALSCTLPAEELVLPMDPARIDQVLLNLVGNAIKFTPPDGRVSIEMGRNNGTVEVAIEDSGIGIAPEHLPRLFDKFYQVDPSNTRVTGGTGLGLYLVKTIVERHGGRVDVASQPGRGSRFAFTLPLAASAPT